MSTSMSRSRRRRRVIGQLSERSLSVPSWRGRAQTEGKTQKPSASSCCAWLIGRQALPVPVWLGGFPEQQARDVESPKENPPAAACQGRPRSCTFRSALRVCADRGRGHQVAAARAGGARAPSLGRPRGASTRLGRSCAPILTTAVKGLPQSHHFTSSQYEEPTCSHHPPSRTAGAVPAVAHGAFCRDPRHAAGRLRPPLTPTGGGWPDVTRVTRWPTQIRRGWANSESVQHASNLLSGAQLLQHNYCFQKAYRPR